MTTRLAVYGALVAVFCASCGYLAGLIGSAINSWIALGMFVVMCVLAAAVGSRAFKNTGEAIASVESAVDRLAAGDLETRVNAEGSAAAVLTRSFNSMARQLQATFDEQEAQHARLEAVFDAVADAMLALSADGSVRFLNPAAREQLQVTAESAIGRPFIQSVRDFELDGLARQTIGSREPQTRIITYGQRRTPLRASVVPIRGGGEWSVLVMLTDLTEERRLDTMRREFVANVSHELRTPLASIRALAETIENGYVEPEEMPAFTGRIQDQVTRLTSLVNELLDLSRIEAGAVMLTPERIVLADAVREALGTLQPRMHASNVSANVGGDNAVAVEADRPSLLRVLANLLDNAIKYSPPGGTIWVEIRAGEATGEVAIRDEGPGIPPEERLRVFERFYTGDKSRAGTGVGLGLAIVKHLVRAHNGSVEVTSAPGEGATFTLRLPQRFSGYRAAERLR